MDWGWGVRVGANRHSLSGKSEKAVIPELTLKKSRNWSGTNKYVCEGEGREQREWEFCMYKGKKRDSYIVSERKTSLKS